MGMIRPSTYGYTIENMETDLVYKKVTVMNLHKHANRLTEEIREIEERLRWAKFLYYCRTGEIYVY